MRKHNFEYLLAGLLIILILDPMLDVWLDDMSNILFEASYLVALIIGVWSLLHDRRWFVIGVILAVLAVAMTAMSVYLKSMPVLVIDLGIMLVFFLLTAIFALRYIFIDKELSLNKLMGSLCVYLLMGIIWSILYIFADLHTPGAFSNLQGTPGEFLYYSFVTLTTLGYGSIVPLTPLTRTLAYLEAIAGQFYLAVLVAGLVGAYVSQRMPGGGQTESTPVSDAPSPAPGARQIASRG